LVIAINSRRVSIYTDVVIKCRILRSSSARFQMTRHLPILRFIIFLFKDIRYYKTIFGINSLLTLRELIFDVIYKQMFILRLSLRILQEFRNEDLESSSSSEDMRRSDERLGL
jgi:hypothetical protein